MNDRARLTAALGAAVVAGFALAAVVLPVRVPAAVQAPIGRIADPDSICTTTSDGATLPFYAEMSAVTMSMHGNMDVAPSGDIDRDFMRMMIPHHQGAIDMALVLLKYGRDEKLRRLAQSIVVEQGQEVAYMNTLLAPPTAAPSAAQHAAHH